MGKLFDVIDRVLEQIFLVPQSGEEVSFSSYQSKIDSGEWKDKLVFGVAQDKRGFYSVDPVEVPGVLAAGGMGSGKSIATRHILFTHMFANSENTFYIIADAAKGAQDYKKAFGERFKTNVATALMSPEALVPLVDLVHAEQTKRKEIFGLFGSAKIYDFDRTVALIAKETTAGRGKAEIAKKLDLPIGAIDYAQKKHPNGEPCARIVITLEEFHAIPNSKAWNFGMNMDTPGTAANQLKDILRAGRSFGITCLFATQRAVSDDVPSTLKVGIQTMLAFKTKDHASVSAMDLPHADQILTGQNGRCAYERGFMQFPYLTDRAIDLCFKKYFKPLRAKLLGTTVESFQTASESEGTTGMVKIKPLGFLVENSSQFDTKDIAERILKIFDFSVQKQGNKAFVADLIASRNGENYAVAVECESSGGGRYARGASSNYSQKQVETLKESLVSLKCKGVIAFCFEDAGPLSAFAEKHGNILVTKDEMKHLGDLLDSREKFEDANQWQSLIDKNVLSKHAMATAELENSGSSVEDADDLSELRGRVIGSGRGRRVR